MQISIVILLVAAICEAGKINGKEVSDACEKANKEELEALSNVMKEAIELTQSVSNITDLRPSAELAAKAASGIADAIKATQAADPSKPLSDDLVRKNTEASAHIDDIGPFVLKCKDNKALSQEAIKEYKDYQTAGRTYLSAHIALHKECGDAVADEKGHLRAVSDKTYGRRRSTPISKRLGIAV